MEEIFKNAADIIKNADALLITAGAGMGVDSGLPDFRGVEGFWRAYPVIKDLGIRFEQMANPAWFEKKPRLAWAFYGHRYNLYRKTVPHDGFSILMKFAKMLNNNYFVVTSNVDGHFQKAGFDNQKINEIHGSINHLQCVNLCTSKIWSANDLKIEIDEQKFEALGELPSCHNCNSIARPNILMFGDYSWISTRSEDQSTNFHNWIDKQKNINSKIVVIELGAGVAVPSIRFLSKRIVKNYNAKLIRINPRDTKVPNGQISIPLGAMQSLSEIEKELF